MRGIDLDGDLFGFKTTSLTGTRRLMLTFKGRGDFSPATLIEATLLRARSLKGALASHSSRDIWGFGCNVEVGGAAERR